MGGNGISPCASCKLLRRRCAKDCIFAPYFPSDDPQKFFIVHKVFGASNINKMLQELPGHQRTDAVSSLVYEATARMRDPVHGCVGAISYLQNQVSQLQMQLAIAQAEILGIEMQQQLPLLVNIPHHEVEDDAVNSNSTLFVDDQKLFYYDLPCYSFGSSPVANQHVMQETCFKREPFFEKNGHHDMVS